MPIQDFTKPIENTEIKVEKEVNYVTHTTTFDNRENMIIPKGTKRLIEIEYLEDTPYLKDVLLQSVYKGIPIPADTFKVNTIYSDTMPEVKDRLLKVVTDLIKNI